MREIDYLKSKISELKKQLNSIVINIQICINHIKNLKQDISDDLQIRHYYLSFTFDDLKKERNLLKLYSKESKDIKEEIKILNRLLDLYIKYTKKNIN